MDRFRFQSSPFTREINIEHRYKAHHIEEQVGSLLRAVEDRQSAVLVAPAGTGKTVALRALCDFLPETRYKVSYLKLSDLSARDMSRQIAFAIGVPPAGLYPGLIRNIEEKLRSSYVEGGFRQIIIFDDAHEMRPQVLRLLRLLTNFEMDSRLVVSVVLAGQLKLKTILMEDSLEDVRGRLAHCGELRLLTREETRAYVRHRSLVAGANEPPFEPQAIEALHEVSHGNMRAIDKLAVATLIEADAAGRNCADASDVAVARTRTWM